ncbi:MAG: S8 family serine peptidase [Ardenticatenaceae bacterium]|nr:S8 family serine peptidase [Ardenticatenaceae bacterium]
MAQPIVRTPDESGLTIESAEAIEVGVGVVSEPKGATGPALYLIRLKDEPIATYKGGVAGLEATSPEGSRINRLDMESPAVLSYGNYLLSKQADFISEAAQVLDRDIEPAYQYSVANNGLAIMMTPEEAAAVSKLPGVIFVQRDFERQLQTDNGPAWVGAPGLWDGSNTGGIPGTYGEGMIVGVIDTGINPLNPSFADVGGDSYDHTNPFGAGNYVGVCDSNDPSYDPTFPCNDKLIGARGYISVNGGDPTDYDGHGSHTASTAAGNFVEATVTAPTLTVNRNISGVAPHANIIAYAACCTASALSAAIDDAIADGVDVINYSIGSDAASDLWNDFDSVGFLNAREAGIFVATSAGNNGPGAETVGSPADAPWLTSVGNSTHDRVWLNSVTNMSGGDTTPPADITGKGFTSGFGPATIVYAGDYASTETDTPELCGVGAIGDNNSPWPVGTFNGEIVVCDRGTFGRVEKGANVLAAGAGGYILINDAASGNALVGDAHVLPGVHISYADGLVLKAWLASGTGHTATIAGATLNEDAGNADIMSSSSSRGANRALPDIISPNVTAPGTDILAAYGTGGAIEWDMISGTSMASPHVAGAGALLMSLHPDWTPAEIQSALMTTGVTDMLKEDGTTPADPFDYGGGRINLNVAALAGLVLDESIINYQNANPANGGDAKTLNIASFGNAQCLLECSWTRTVRSTQAASVTWTASVAGPMGLTVTPASFVLGPGETQEIVVTADVSALPAGDWVFGEVTLEPSVAGIPTAGFPVAVIPTTGIIPTSVEIDTRRNAGSFLIEDMQSMEITELTTQSFGLTQADLTDFALYQDPTNDISAGEFFDDLSQVFWMTVEVPADSMALIAEIADTTSPDVDMAVGTGSTPSAATQVCQSASNGSSEFCSVADPAAGTWWVLVMNWEESVNAPDDVTLATAVVPYSDAGNMSFEGPTSVPQLDPFSLRLFWDTPEMVAGDRWYGAFTLGSDAGNPGNIGMIPVFITRHEDDVTKTVSSESAYAGDTVTYTITVQPNVTTEDLLYTITDAIPAGLTYVPGTATASAGVVDVVGDTLTWSGTMEVVAPTYAMSTSLENTSCAMPLATDGGYVDLSLYGILPNSVILGDSVEYTWTPDGDAPIQFYGMEVGNTIHFSDDGFVFFDSSTGGSTPWTNESIPNASDPNNLIAPLWKDMEIVYEAGTRGVALVSLNTGPGTPNVGHIIDYKGVEAWGQSDQRYDTQVYISRYTDDTPGEYEIVFAYNNLTGNLDVGTIGVENAYGTKGVQYAYNDATLLALQDEMAICFDLYVPVPEPVTITYEATVDAGMAVPTTLTNTAVHDTDDPGSLSAAANADLAIQTYILYMPVVAKD